MYFISHFIFHFLRYLSHAKTPHESSILSDFSFDNFIVIHTVSHNLQWTL